MLECGEMDGRMIGCTVFHLKHLKAVSQNHQLAYKMQILLSCFNIRVYMIKSQHSDWFYVQDKSEGTSVATCIIIQPNQNLRNFPPI